MDEYRQLYKKTVGGLDNLSSDVLDKLALNVSKLLKGMTEDEKLLSLDAMTSAQVKRLFIVAYESKNYEVCQSIKEKWER